MTLLTSTRVRNVLTVRALHVPSGATVELCGDVRTGLGLRHEVLARLRVIVEIRGKEAAA